MGDQFSKEEGEEEGLNQMGDDFKQRLAVAHGSGENKERQRKEPTNNKVVK
jgi:hypothetical protein